MKADLFPQARTEGGALSPSPRPSPLGRGRSAAQSHCKTGASQFRRGFTLIEIMVVVAIMGLIMAMGVPSVLASMKKQGMRKVISDLTDAFDNARRDAILQNKTVQLVFHPGEKTFGSSALPAGMEFEMLNISRLDFTESPDCWINFNPDGTCDETTIVLHAKDQRRKITLDYSTCIAEVSDVDQ